MRIGILGTRGIPNHYGGFEQFADFLAEGLVGMGHEVYVYNSHNHPYQEKTYKGAHLIHTYDPEFKIGTAGQFIYDLNCVLDSRKRKFDILLQLGYTSSSIWSFLMPSKSCITTNMDGLEWKRSKYSAKVQLFLKKAEKWAVKNSDHLVADSIGIQEYLKGKYDVDSTYIPYGAEEVVDQDESLIKKYDVETGNYYLLIARMEPENNVETILKAYTRSEREKPFLVVGKTENTFGKYLRKKFCNHKNIRFLEGIYNMKVLDNLRFYSAAYFHGHSVGGTNPSLLEAMASSAFIVANDNVFNKAILEDDAIYFDGEASLSSFFDRDIPENFKKSAIANNLKKVRARYSWDRIIRSYADLFEELTKPKA